MNPKTYKTTFDVHLPAGPGQAPRFLETIEVEAYRNFGEEFLTPESSQRVENIKARHLGIMTGEDIKALRRRLNLTQKELTDRLTCGEKMVSYWENGHGFPTGPANLLLRLLEEGHLGLTQLAAVAGPRAATAGEHFFRSRESNVIYYDFSKARVPAGSSAAGSDDALLQPAANS